MNRFLERFTNTIVFPLACFDRVIFKGYHPVRCDAQLNAFVDYRLRMRRRDFIPFVELQAQRLVDHAKRMAEDAQVPYLFLQGHHRKEQLIQKIIKEKPIGNPFGLVAVLCVMETCRTVKLLYGKGQPVLKFTHRPQRVLYFYFLDEQFGLCHFRIQTWFPFTTQAYVNGHEWLARQMLQRNIDFVQIDNAFVDISHPKEAQKYADRFVQLAWPTILRAWLSRCNPLLRDFPGMTDFYWVIDQAEFSTDILISSREALADLYPRLLDHASLHFSAKDILSFLGRRLHPRFDGEVLTLCGKDRFPGARIKHRVKNNWIKMYDKMGRILRIETVINQPREFHVRRWRTRNGKRAVGWVPMNKGVANLFRYREIALAANNRYLEALSVVDPAPQLGKAFDDLSQPRRLKKKRVRGLNPLSKQDLALFQAVLSGEHRLHGFRNRDISQILHRGKAGGNSEKQKRMARISRLLRILRAHKLIAKIPRTHRYQITPNGETFMGAALKMRFRDLDRILQNPA